MCIITLSCDYKSTILGVSAIYEKKEHRLNLCCE